jgi:hypothetical protein
MLQDTTSILFVNRPLRSGPRAILQQGPFPLRSFVSASTSALSIPLSVSNATGLVFDKLNTTSIALKYIVWGCASTEQYVPATIHKGEV